MNDEPISIEAQLSEQSNRIEDLEFEIGILKLALLNHANLCVDILSASNGDNEAETSTAYHRIKEALIEARSFTDFDRKIGQFPERIAGKHDQ